MHYFQTCAYTKRERRELADKGGQPGGKDPFPPNGDGPHPVGGSVTSVSYHKQGSYNIGTKSK